MIALAIPMIIGKVKPNVWYGFRTKKTLSDNKIWYPANKYAGKQMIIASLIIIIISLSFLIINLKSDIFLNASELIVFIVWLIVYMAPIAIMLVSSLIYLKKL
jgi:uncharacterized membrane protein